MTDKPHKSPVRTEKDSLGEIEVPADALYAAQTQRAVNNFTISDLRMPRAFIRALGLVKHACAQANADLGLLTESMRLPIATAATQVVEGHHDNQFPVDVFQTGSGTSSNMNANEVIARLASGQSGQRIHPNDHVNMSQSSNDVIPACIHVSAALLLFEELSPALTHLRTVIEQRSNELQSTVKTGRTHLMDALPLTLGQELGGWNQQLLLAEQRLHDSTARLTRLAIGGTAIGTGLNADHSFGARVASVLTELTGLEFSTQDNYFSGISSQDTAVEVSGQLRALAVAVMKISNDLRWMNSGPLSGLAEIELPVLQPGSSIMPGKVNPVVPEATAMACAQVMGNDVVIGIAGQSGNFQLNVMLPVIAYNLLQSMSLMSGACRALADRAIAGFRVNSERLEEGLRRNPILVTALNREVGYEKGAAIAKKAYAERRPVLEVAEEMTNLGREELLRLLDPQKLTRGGLTD